MRNFHKYLIGFLIVNFIALGLGGMYTGDGVTSDWYQNLNKAPWTPPGWVFGTAWALIMICFSFYMAYALDVVKDKTNLLFLFALQFVLNVGWNPLFFRHHEVLWGLIVISTLLLLMCFFYFKYRNKVHSRSNLLVPYILWLVIATSLNAYIMIYN